MIYKLKPRAFFNTQNYEEREGMISIYLCTKCSKLVTYSYIADGITPVKLTCVACGGIAMVEEKERIQQPDRIWYRPENISEIEKLAWIAYECGLQAGHYKDAPAADIVAYILTKFVEHYNGGGLFARTLDEWVKI